VSLSASQQLELAAISASAERRNQPRLLILLAGALIVIAAIYAFSGFGAARAAHDRARAQAVSAAQIDRLIERYTNLTESGAEGALVERFPVNNRVRSTLESSAEFYGLDTPTLSLRRDRVGLDYPLQRQIVTAQLSDAPLEPALKWINNALNTIDGLFISGVEISPTPRGWPPRSVMPVG